ncbi:MAG: hypothetical protein P0116_13385, partial [Candidatus Nitrosocosmicus sp.]|nr:hypothetical protein [Candidatus Nitrosocosmicus sp.]
LSLSNEPGNEEIVPFMLFSLELESASRVELESASRVELESASRVELESASRVELESKLAKTFDKVDVDRARINKLIEKTAKKLYSSNLL